MLTPGKIYVGTELRLTATYRDSSGTLTDPATVTFETRDPYGTLTSYVYGTDAEIDNSSTGNFYCDITPDKGGRWHYRWKATGTGTTINDEGSFIVIASPFVDYVWDRDYA